MKNSERPINPLMDGNELLRESNTMDDWMEKETPYIGLTKREYFAGLAMQGILASRELQLALYADCKNEKQNSMSAIAIEAVKQADELLTQLSNEKK